MALLLDYKVDTAEIIARVRQGEDGRKGIDVDLHDAGGLALVLQPLYMGLVEVINSVVSSDC